MRESVRSENRRVVRDALVALMLLGLVMAVIATCSSCVRGIRATAEEQHGRAVVVANACPSPNGWTLSHSSGVRVDATHVLTAWHSVDCTGGTIAVTELGGGGVRISADAITFDADVVAVVDVADVRSDVARLVTAEKPGVRPVRVGRAGRFACVESSYPAVSRRCSAPDFMGLGFALEVETVPGNSGSGVYSDGRLVGIIVRRSADSTRGFAVSLWERKWLLP